MGFDLVIGIVFVVRIDLEFGIALNIEIVWGIALAKEIVKTEEFALLFD